jgi:hypothetical protein
MPAVRERSVFGLVVTAPGAAGGPSTPEDAQTPVERISPVPEETGRSSSVLLEELDLTRLRLQLMPLTLGFAKKILARDSQLNLHCTLRSEHIEVVATHLANRFTEVTTGLEIPLGRRATVQFPTEHGISQIVFVKTERGFVRELPKGAG